MHTSCALCCVPCNHMNQLAMTTTFNILAKGPIIEQKRKSRLLHRPLSTGTRFVNARSIATCSVTSNLTRTICPPLLCTFLHVPRQCGLMDLRHCFLYYVILYLFVSLAHTRQGIPIGAPTTSIFCVLWISGEGATKFGREVEETFWWPLYPLSITKEIKTKEYTLCFQHYKGRVHGGL